MLSNSDYAKTTYKHAIDLRMRVKELDAERIGVTAENRKFIVFFVSPALLTTKSNQSRTLFAEIDNFDIRKGTSERLFKKPEATEDLLGLKPAGPPNKKENEF